MCTVCHLYIYNCVVYPLQFEWEQIIYFIQITGVVYNIVPQVSTSYLSGISQKSYVETGI